MRQSAVPCYSIMSPVHGDKLTFSAVPNHDGKSDSGGGGGGDNEIREGHCTQWIKNDVCTVFVRWRM